MPRAGTPSTLPLLAWPELQRIAEMECRRAALHRRLLHMAPRSRHRLRTESEIAALTREILALDITLRREPKC
ncbi:hypothetical protein [Ancylobacter defluvii]|uniref:Uncharacterized protein n=1 Tax=Ancylobacter defluvii TaxID=1282440 RepID=A0A9W6K0F3_9HYPH|nr:hypothetical protein [Ancylobacter defluvii]MBS7586428.1 hypothetical protein [Ancylobacter defluvii]GLK85709.1 hypothetical protein GCM10017653_37790 [Ancylobacter defluvii]